MSNINLERGVRKNYWNSGSTEYLYYYKGLGYRWEDTVYPQMEDEECFETEEQAIAYVDSLKLSLGFYGLVERVEILPEDADGIEDVSELIQLNYKNCSHYESEELHAYATNEGRDIEGGIIIEWSWEKYPGYCRNFKEIGIAGDWPFHDFKAESDLLTGNEERTFHSNYDILLYPDEIEGLSDVEVEVLVEERLRESHWKWNYFKNNPYSINIASKIGLDFEEE